nr:flagellar export chaperone FliS [Saccharophagus degradans]
MPRKFNHRGRPVNTRRALNSYAKVSCEANIGVASPHELIQMLYDGALQRIVQAKGAIQHNQVGVKGKKINETIAIINGLRENLDVDNGGDLANNMEMLYIYILSVLNKAHQKNDIALLDEAAQLIGNMASAWREISPSKVTESSL